MAVGSAFWCNSKQLPNRGLVRWHKTPGLFLTLEIPSMKKTLIALAAVAVTGAAFAQSSVTLSGQVETGLEKRWSGDATRMTSNRNGTSNWTLRGTEDLGGGMNAVFQVSTSFNPDDGTAGGLSTGTTGTVLGNNGMFVGVTGGFGTFRMGRPANTLFANALFANGTKGVSAHDSNTLLSNMVANAGNSVYVNNGVQYHTPVMGGFQVQVEYAPAELGGASAGTGIALRYAAGPIVATFTNYKGAGTGALLKPKAVNQLAGSYDFGLARVFLTYRDDGNLAAAADTGYALGATAPVGPGSLYFSYNVREQATADAKTVIGGYKYNLSKRTQAFVNVAQRNAAYAGAVVTANGGNGAKKSTGFGFGLQHSF
jgi:predicted porin